MAAAGTSSFPQSGSTDAPAGGDAHVFEVPAETHAHILQDKSLQFDFPPLAPSEPPAWLEPLARMLQTAAPALLVLFWIAVGLLAAFVIYVLVRTVLQRMPERKAKQNAARQETTIYAPERQRALTLLQDADKLAAEGRFSEATRVLLHRSIDDLNRQFRLTLRPGYTSREIAKLKQLSDEGRAVFSNIARAVEVSLFGGVDLGAEDYRLCREHYATFALPSGGR